MKEWVKVSRAANGKMSVTVTLQDDNLTSKWAVEAYSNAIPKAVKEARKYAADALAQVREAVQ